MIVLSKKSDRFPLKGLHGIAKALTKTFDFFGGFGCGRIDSHDFKGHWLGMKNYRNDK